MRKIRCSGELADGSGCMACQAAGVSPGHCVFLRVKCESRELMPDHMLVSWPTQTSDRFTHNIPAERYQWVGSDSVGTNYAPAVLEEEQLQRLFYHYHRPFF